MTVVGLLNVGRPQPWMDRAICSQTDPETFFPNPGDNQREGKAICVHCPVRKECLQYAMDHDEEFGIWGGLGPKERSDLKRGKRKTADVFIECVNGHDLSLRGSRMQDGRCQRCYSDRKQREHDRLLLLGLKGRGNNSPHGTLSRSKSGCRCQECIKAARAYYRDYQQRRKGAS